MGQKATVQDVCNEFARSCAILIELWNRCGRSPTLADTIRIEFAVELDYFERSVDRLALCNPDKDEHSKISRYFRYRHHALSIRERSGWDGEPFFSIVKRWSNKIISADEAADEFIGWLKGRTTRRHAEAIREIGNCCQDLRSRK